MSAARRSATGFRAEVTSSLILKGVAIGDRSIVGAGAVVTKSVPPDVIVAGNPAQVVKSLGKLEMQRHGRFLSQTPGPEG
jgi:serine acetyltransferase